MKTEQKRNQKRTEVQSEVEILHLFFVEDALKEDSGLFAPRWQMDDLNRETRQLNQEIDRLAAKLQQLNAQFNPSKPTQD